MLDLSYGALVQWFGSFSSQFLIITALCLVGAIFGILKEFFKHV